MFPRVDHGLVRRCHFDVKVRVVSPLPRGKLHVGLWLPCLGRLLDILDGLLALYRDAHGVHVLDLLCALLLLVNGVGALGIFFQLD